MSENIEKLSLKEALAELGISRTTLYQRIKEGRITPLPGPSAAKKRAAVEFAKADVMRLKQEGLQ